MATTYQTTAILDKDELDARIEGALGILKDILTADRAAQYGLASDTFSAHAEAMRAMGAQGATWEDAVKSLIAAKCARLREWPEVEARDTLLDLAGYAILALACDWRSPI